MKEGRYVSKQIRFKITKDRVLHDIKYVYKKTWISPKKISDKYNRLSFKKFEHITSGNKAVDEKIFLILSNNCIRQGKSEYVVGKKKEFIEKIKYFTQKNKPILITIMGFPGKIPNPLKTSRILPDLGEGLYINRLEQISKLVSTVYKPSVQFICCLEGKVLRHITDIKLSEINKYNSYLHKLLKNSGSKNVRLFELEVGIKRVKNFHKVQSKIYKTIKNNYLIDGDTRRAVDQVLGTISTCINVREYSLADLMVIYSNNKLQKNNKIFKKILDSSFRYLAFHWARNDTNFMDTIFGIHIDGTGSPKPGHLGLHLINNRNILLPYHGVPVIENDKIRIDHELNIRKNGHSFIGICQPGEKSPFYYKKIK